MGTAFLQAKALAGCFSEASWRGARCARAAGVESGTFRVCGWQCLWARPLEPSHSAARETGPQRRVAGAFIPRRTLRPRRVCGKCRVSKEGAHPAAVEPQATADAPCRSVRRLEPTATS